MLRTGLALAEVNSPFSSGSDEEVTKWTTLGAVLVSGCWAALGDWRSSRG